MTRSYYQYWKLDVRKIRKIQKKKSGLAARMQAIQEMQDRTGVTSVDYLKYFYQSLSDARLTPELRATAADLALKLYRAQAFEEAWDSKVHFMELYQAKQAIDQLVSQENAPTYPIEKTVLDQKGADAPSYNLAVYDFLKGVYGDLDEKTESRQRSSLLTALCRTNHLSFATSRRKQTSCL